MFTEHAHFSLNHVVPMLSHLARQSIDIHPVVVLDVQHQVVQGYEAPCSAHTSTKDSNTIHKKQNKLGMIPDYDSKFWLQMFTVKNVISPNSCDIIVKEKYVETDH